MLSILHISDLHRSASDPVGNNEVISSLLSDRDRYVVSSPSIRMPNCIVVSGDLIQGTHLGDTNHLTTLKEQYQQASELLDELAQRFVSGDRSRIAICAGNHDICWNTAFSSMCKVEETEELENLGHTDFFSCDSQYRWNWKEKSAYKIQDRDVYEARLNLYWEFIEDFYRDANLRFPVQREAGYSIFEIIRGKVVVAAFNSTKGNDCFAFHGAIDPDHVADCAIRLRDCGEKFALKIAVWHHGVYAPPPNVDYMSMDPIFDLANQGFGFGLHGHQHQASHTVQYIHIPEQRRFPIISAGSLCAGENELPAGYNRQYNVVEIEENFASGKVFVRERTHSNIFTASARPEFGINGAIDFELDPPDMRSQEAGIDVLAISEAHQISLAEEHLRSGNSVLAVEILEKCDVQTDHFARRLFFEAVKESESWASLVVYANDPRTISELVLICDAITHVKDIESAIKVAEAYIPSDSQEKALRTEILDRLSTKKMMRR